MAKANPKPFDPADVKTARQLIYPTLKTEPGVTLFVEILEPMAEGKRIEQDGDDERGPKRGPATILKVTCLHAGDKHPLNGKDCQIVANKLLVGALNENYPNGSYVGKRFAITKAKDKKHGKQGDYYPFEVNEIE